ncbi:MAG: hypothetical protein MZV70_18420 [Desulfobacterales bacterium]|nr:hypothetical protein [Desulfobacterales bacterium]
MTVDYARIAVAVDGERKVLKALRHALTFLKTRFFRAWAVYLLIVVLTVAGTIVFSILFGRLGALRRPGRRRPGLHADLHRLPDLGPDALRRRPGGILQGPPLLREPNEAGIPGRGPAGHGVLVLRRGRRPALPRRLRTLSGEVLPRPELGPVPGPARRPRFRPPDPRPPRPQRPPPAARSRRLLGNHPDDGGDGRHLVSIALMDAAAIQEEDAAFKRRRHAQRGPDRGPPGRPALHDRGRPGDHAPRRGGRPTTRPSG